MLRQHTALLIRLTSRFAALTAIMVSSFHSPQARARDTTSQAQTPLRQSVITSSGNALSFLVSGETHGLPVIFVHGTPGDAKGWIEYLQKVPDGFRFIAIDRPGFGESGPDSETSLANQAKAVADLVTDLRLSPAILVGHSLGGPIIAQTAIDHPDLVAGLVILAGSLDPAQEDVPFIQYIGDTWPISAILPRGVRNANREIIALEPQLQDLAPRLSTIKSPTIIVHGTKDDLVPFANVSFMKARMSGSTIVSIVELQGQNHFLPWNSKQHVDSAILELARKSTSRAGSPAND